MNTTRCTDNLHVFDGAVNTGVLVAGTEAVLFDCCDTVTPERLAALGVERVVMILATQHRRMNTAGARPFLEAGAELVVPAGEQPLFDDVESYWNDDKNRWHLYHHQPGPMVQAASLPVTRAVAEGNVITWQGTEIRVLDTPGATDGSVSYLIELEGTTYCFSGDCIYAPGRVWDFSSLQKKYGRLGDYHGFIGNKEKLIPSLKKLKTSGADVLVPAHGEIMHDPAAAINALLENLDAVWRNYTSISCLNHYFAGIFDDTKDDPLRMKPVPTRKQPTFVTEHVYTSFGVRSETGAFLLIDCGIEKVVDKVQEWLDDGEISEVEGCWITHYHDDHVDGLGVLQERIGCPVLTVDHMAEVIEHPERFFLPCISPVSAPVVRKHDGETWRWHEFALTAYHFPGQTFYHSGLLVEGHGTSVFFAGDSGSPTGIDDHCCPNRNFLGMGRGFRRCFAIWRRHKPEYIFNEHQTPAFSFTDADLDYMDDILEKREALFADVLPWEHPNFGIDESWVRVYPYEQDAAAGASFRMDVQFTNHASVEITAKAEPVLPEGWTWDTERSTAEITIPAETYGTVDDYVPNPDKAAEVWITPPENTVPGKYIIPFRITWNGRYLGAMRNGIVNVK